MRFFFIDLGIPAVVAYRGGYRSYVP